MEEEGSFMVEFSAVTPEHCRGGRLWDLTNDYRRYRGLKALQAAREALGDPSLRAEQLLDDQYNDSWNGKMAYTLHLSEEMALQAGRAFEWADTAPVSVPAWRFNRYARVVLERYPSEEGEYYFWTVKIDWQQVLADWIADGAPLYFWDPGDRDGRKVTLGEWCPERCKKWCEKLHSPWKDPDSDPTRAFLMQAREECALCNAEREK